jgi:hypothetical protein
MSQYSELLKDPRWQKKRLEILQRDNWTCQICYDTESMLVVHHRKYLDNTLPWDYPNNILVTLCESCHQCETNGRPLMEEYLLDSLKDKFFTKHLKELVDGFYSLKLKQIPDLVSSAYSEALSKPEIQFYLLDEYYKNLHSKQKVKAK